MQLTIVKPDNLVILDHRGLQFELDSFDCPDNLHALQWTTESQNIEYTDQLNEPLTELPLWTQPVIEEHQRLIQQQNEQQKQEEAIALFINNGSARKQRIGKQQEQSVKDEFITLKQQVNHLINAGS